MVWCLWAAKGGSGCSVVAASAAMLMARRGPVLLVDLAGGDLARILGVEPAGPGLVRWLRHANPPPDALTRLELPVADGLALLPLRGSDQPAVDDSAPDAVVDLGERLTVLAHLLAADDRAVIVDLGVQRSGASVACGVSVAALAPIGAVAERSTLVTRLCYLSVAAAMDLPVADDVIVVAEPDRALRIGDVSAALRAPVTTVRWDPAVARAVDAGLLTRRLPRALARLPLAVDAPAAATGRAAR